MNTNINVNNSPATAQDDSDNEKDLKIEAAEMLTAEDKAKLPIFEEMVKAGIIYGRKKSKLNPKMRPYVYTVRVGIALFDLSKTLEQIDKAAAFLKEKISANGKVLVVATQPAAKDLAKKFAEDNKQFYVVERWLGGTLTNFKTISQRVDYFKKLKADKESGRHEKYTKKERLMIDRDIEKLNSFFSGVESMSALPDVVFIINPTLHETALREARRVKVPVVALLNTDADPELVTYPIPGNANARLSIAWVLEKIDKAIK